jgi:hypothetical protein
VTPDTARLIRMCLSSLIAGAMGVGSTLLASMQGDGHIPPGALLIALITGGLLCGKDLQSYLSQAPGQGH